MDRDKKWNIKKGWPEPIGVSYIQGGVNFAVETEGEESFELVVYKKGTTVTEMVIPVPPKFKFGNVLAWKISGFSPEHYEYTYRVNGEECLDRHAFSIEGKRTFGSWEQPDKGHLRCGFPDRHDFSWRGESAPQIPLNEVIAYNIHVRGFTRHASSKVQHRGTFLGIEEKIPYFQELGVNQLILQPVYEFAETIPIERMRNTQYRKNLDEPCLNYWGYSDDNYYYAVKKTYAATQNEREEFKHLVRELHRHGIEIVLEFYFARRVSIAMVADCLKYWVLTYHVDGFYISGARIAVEDLFQEPLLADKKLYANGLDIGMLPMPEAGGVDKRRAAICSVDYMTNMRSFLKGDSGKLADAAYYMRRNETQNGYINYFACHDGFTMADMVSFDHKHNEANGEGNLDGWEYNFSWNCGVEGKTRKTKILQLRRRQMKNAWVMLFFSQGIPAILAGDEYCNSQNGNNNVYGQDNENGWMHWKSLKYYDSMLEFVKKLIQLRKEHLILHLRQKMLMTKEMEIAYPDVSYHSEQAWYIDFRSNRYSLGILYCGAYAKKQDGSEDDYFFMAYNMYWNEQSFALPKLPNDRKWYWLIDTGIEESFFEEQEEVKEKTLEVSPRTSVVLIGKKVRGKAANGRKKKRS